MILFFNRLRSKFDKVLLVYNSWILTLMLKEVTITGFSIIPLALKISLVLSLYIITGTPSSPKLNKHTLNSYPPDTWFLTL